MSHMKNSMFFIDSEVLWFEDFRAALAPGYRFDYGEGRLRITVEVVEVTRGELIELELLVIDDTYSRREPPRRGNTFTAAFAPSSSVNYVWGYYPIGYFRRRAEWRRKYAE